MDGYLEPLCADMAKLGNTGGLYIPSIYFKDMWYGSMKGE